MDKITFKNGSQPAINDTNLNLLQTNIENEINKIKTEVLKLAFPIGQPYVTQDNTNPNSILGFGTWERLKGKVCLGLDEDDEDFNEIGKTGGEKTHTLTNSELPLGIDGQRNSDTGSDWQKQGATAKTATAFNIMQPYEITGYMWIRRS